MLALLYYTSSPCFQNPVGRLTSTFSFTFLSSSSSGSASGSASASTSASITRSLATTPTRSGLVASSLPESESQTLSLGVTPSQARSLSSSQTRTSSSSMIPPSIAPDTPFYDPRQLKVVASLMISLLQIPNVTSFIDLASILEPLALASMEVCIRVVGATRVTSNFKLDPCACRD